MTGQANPLPHRILWEILGKYVTIAWMGKRWCSAHCVDFSFFLLGKMMILKKNNEAMAACHLP